MQYGILYKMNIIYLNTVTKLLIIYKNLLTIPCDYDTLIMLGRLWAAPFRMSGFVV